MTIEKANKTKSFENEIDQQQEFLKLLRENSLQDH
jgi:hypothetical protein